jgi:hypothetical protein
MSVPKQKCSTCTETKPLGEFWKLAPMIARKAGRSHALECRACRVVAMAARRAERAAGAEQPAAEQPAAEEPPDPNQPRLVVPSSAKVDVAWDGTDFVLTQDNDGAEMTIFLAPHALRRIFEFGEALALQQQAPTPEAPA